MSGKLTGQIWGLKLAPAKRDLLMALADHAKDDGSNAYPSVDFLAWKLDISPRTVQRLLRELEHDGLILATTRAGRSKPTVYKIDLSNGVKKSPFIGRQNVTTKHDKMSPQMEQERVTPHEKVIVEKGDTPSAILLRNHKDQPSVKERDKKNISVGRAPNPMYDAIYATWGYTAALNGEMQKMLEGGSKRAGFKEYNLDTPINAEDLRKWAAWYRKTELHDDLGLNMVADRMKVQSSITAWQVRQAKRQADDAIRAEADRIWNEQRTAVHAS